MGIPILDPFKIKEMGPHGPFGPVSRTTEYKEIYLITYVLLTRL